MGEASVLQRSCAERSPPRSRVTSVVLEYLVSHLLVVVLVVLGPVNALELPLGVGERDRHAQRHGQLLAVPMAHLGLILVGVSTTIIYDITKPQQSGHPENLQT